MRRFSPAEAAGYAARADELAPSSASAIALGLIYRDLGRTDDAARAMERALRLDPGNLEVYADLCDLLMDAGLLDEALACARRALAIDPGYTCCQIAALAVRFRQGRQAADLDDLIRLCQAQPAGTHARRHGDQVLGSTVRKTANRTTTIHGSPHHLLRLKAAGSPAADQVGRGLGATGSLDPARRSRLRSRVRRAGMRGIAVRRCCR